MRHSIFVDGVYRRAPGAFSPAPRAIRRAFLLRIDLGPVPTG